MICKGKHPPQNFSALRQGYLPNCLFIHPLTLNLEMVSDGLFHIVLVLILSLLIGSCVRASGPLATLPMANPVASQQNLAGIQEFNKGHWGNAREKFELALQADPNLPEAHYNLGLTLHKLDLHDEAKTHFRQAGELNPDNQEIVGSTAFKNHLGLSSTWERHFSGGYRY